MQGTYTMEEDCTGTITLGGIVGSATHWDVYLHRVIESGGTSIRMDERQHGRALVREVASTELASKQRPSDRRDHRGTPSVATLATILNTRSEAPPRDGYREVGAVIETGNIELIGFSRMG